MSNNIFNPNSHLIKVGGKDYLQVQWRLVWFREQCPTGTIDTEEQEVDTEREVTAEVSVWNAEKRRNEKVMKTAKGYARYKAIVTDGKGGRATGHGSETSIDFADYVEKAETKAIGRALAALGYGTQFTGDEFNEAHRIVDSPVNSQMQNEVPAPTAKELYQKGYQKLWNSTSEFFAIASSELSAPIGKNTQLTDTQKLQLLKLVEDTDAVEDETIEELAQAS